MKLRNRPENYLHMGTSGHGLWEIWYDEGEGTFARPVVRGGNPAPIRFLLEVEAQTQAWIWAEQNSERRYKVVLAR